MPVTERVQIPGGTIPGSWTLHLRPTTPANVRDYLNLANTNVGFSHVVITGTRWPDPALSSATLLANARYTGVYYHRDDEFTMSGSGLAYWLETPDGAGYLIEAAAVSFSGSTWQAVVAGLIPATLTSGTIQALGGSYTIDFRWVGRRDALTLAVTMGGGEFRINPNGTVDAGTQTNLYPTTTTPTTIMASTVTSHDWLLNSVPATRLEQASDLDDYTTRVVLNPNATGTGAGNITPSTSYKDLQGNPVGFTRFVTGGDNTAFGSVTDPNTVAAALANATTPLHREISLASDRYDIGQVIRPGDTLHIYDPDRGLYDTTNPVIREGGIIYPIKLRVYGLTWPIEQGMGVYLRLGDATIVDLTDYVAWESGASILEPV